MHDAEIDQTTVRPPQPVSAAEFEAHPHLSQWRVILNGARTTFSCGSYPAATDLAARIAELAEAHGHHPDLDVRYPDRLHVTVSTHATGGLSDRDVTLAAAISQVAAKQGATAQTSAIQAVDIALDTDEPRRIGPFWRAILGAGAGEGLEFRDAQRVGASMWLQQRDVDDRGEHADQHPAGGDPRQRFHLDVYVPADQVEQRLAAALAAGGRLVTERFAPAWWVLADADGNHACVCCWKDPAGTLPVT